MIIHTTNHKSAFSMITAIFVILLLSSVAAFIMNLSGKMIEATTTQYRKEQAILYAKSYTEFAIMSATARDCIKTITANVDGTAAEVLAGQGYRVTVNVQYIGNDLTTAGVANCNTLGNAITNPSSKGSIVLIDTYVRYRNPEHPRAIVRPMEKYHQPYRL